jgi:hypothetical protein
MNIDVGTITTGAIAVVPIIIALVQAVKMLNIANKWMPLVSIGIGVLISFIANHAVADLTHTILTGVMYGLSASGLYSGVKTTADAKNQGTTNGSSNP